MFPVRLCYYRFGKSEYHPTFVWSMGSPQSYTIITGVFRMGSDQNCDNSDLHVFQMLKEKHPSELGANWQCARCGITLRRSKRPVDGDAWISCDRYIIEQVMGSWLIEPRSCRTQSTDIFYLRSIWLYHIEISISEGTNAPVVGTESHSGELPILVVTVSHATSSWWMEY